MGRKVLIGLILAFFGYMIFKHSDDLAVVILAVVSFLGGLAEGIAHIIAALAKALA